MIADVCIVGAGVLGASTAWHLAKLGVGRVVLVDPTPAGGSTARATGGFRSTYASALNVRLSLLARDKLLRFADDTGVDPEFRPVGYLWLATSAAHLTRLEGALAVQRAAGLGDSRLVDAAEARRLNPAVRDERVVGGVFGAGDGTMRPLAILRGYLDDACRHGAVVVPERAVGLLESDRILGVQTETRAIAAETVVLAAGAWTGAFAKASGIDVPITPLRRQVAETAPCPLPEDMPMTLWLDDGFHLRVRDGKALLLRSTPGATDPFDTGVEPGWVDDVAARARARMGGLSDVAIERSYAGLYEMSPDGHALLGPVPGQPGLYVVGGASGHGVMHAPALGQLLAERIVYGEARALDARPLGLERFAEGRAHAPDPL